MAADLVAFAWLDIFLVLAVMLVVVCIRLRRWKLLCTGVASVYLVFFYSWGLNYHREPLSSRLNLATSPGSSAAADDASRTNAFVRGIPVQLNALYAAGSAGPIDVAEVNRECALRVRRVVQVLDGTDWQAAHRIKISILANPWFRIAGIDGVFDPLIHEPIVNSRLLPIEEPFVVCHELAHVRGYPDEGEANFVALMATLISDRPELQYSGWMNLWLYARTPELDRLLDPGPKKDVAAIYQRLRQERIVWISNLQSAVLDWYLKANSVPAGIRSYAQILRLAAASQSQWERFR